MTVTLICFSHVRHALGQDRLSIDLQAGKTAADFVAHVRTLAGGALDSMPLRVSVNQEMLDDSHPISDGDELVLIPPVQGG